jgi:hypothetical protein
MKPEELSRLYNLSCLNAHDLLDELYEAVHTPEGDPKVTADEVKSIRQSFLAKIRQELELMQSAANEYEELQ